MAPILEAVFNHLCLPRKLPGSQDARNVQLQVQNDLIHRLMRACEELKQLTTTATTAADIPISDVWTTLEASLKICSELNQGYLEKSRLQTAFQGLRPGITLMLNIVHQNSALLISSRTGDGIEKVVFECFELSPTTDEVLAAQNALEWEFPGRSIEISIDIFQEASFQSNLAQFLEQACSEKLQCCAAHTTKAGVPVIESRGTTDPALIAQKLMPMLEALGNHFESTKLRKRVRDDVNINNAEIPWRRLPFWLLLRVATHRQLQSRLGDEDGRAVYKTIMSMVFAHFLSDCKHKLSPELSLQVRDKLARRLAKLQQDVDSLQSTTGMLQKLLSMSSNFYEETLDKAGGHITRKCEIYRQGTVRRIERLPSRANTDDLYLRLPNSGGFLTRLLNSPPPQQQANLSTALPKLESAMQQSTRFVRQYVELADFVASTGTEMKEILVASGSPEECCINLAKESARLIKRVGRAYDDNPEQMSRCLLTVFEFWMNIDRKAVEACPLLSDFHPVFTPELLDILQFSSYAELQRIRRVQRYLLNRTYSCRGTQQSIISNVEPKCFASQFVQNSEDLRILMENLEIDSQTARDQKEEEWLQLCARYDELTELILERICECTFDSFGKKIKPVCQKCSCWGARYNLTIAIHEDYLPANPLQRDAMVFEIGMPEFLRAYRDATWNIYSALAHPGRPHDAEPPKKLIEDYGNVTRMDYVDWSPSRITLGSDTKAFIDTHYKWQSVKVDLSKIVLPNPLNLAYWDKKQQHWIAHLDRPLTLQHLCGVHVPRCLRDTLFPSKFHPDTKHRGPSSYEILANQASCPQHVLAQEFASLQQLLSSSSLRWPQILREMEAPNLDFKNEETVLMIGQLVSQAGSTSQNQSIFGDLHFTLQERSFCHKILVAIDEKLDSIELRYHEAPCVALLLTLSSQLLELAPVETHGLAMSIVQKIRSMTLKWTQTIRTELQDCKESVTAASKAKYGLWAALICRRTFLCFLKANSKMKANELFEFTQASLALQWNLVIDPSRLPTPLKNILVSDAQVASGMGLKIRAAISYNASGLESAINTIWSSLVRVQERRYTAWEPVSSPSEDHDDDMDWLVSVATSRVGRHEYRQVIHYNFVEGHLLVNGKPLGKLPENIRESDDVKQIFGGKHLLTCPSNLQGMSHMLVNNERKHGIHFGIRDEVVLIRDLTKEGLFEFIPRHKFLGTDGFDLPSALVHNCVHWLNLNARELHIRSEVKPWVTRPSDWILNVRTRHAKRRNTSLVSPHCELARRIAGNLEGFEKPYLLTICQAENQRASLTVELRHLDLTFIVNNRGCLQSRELNTEIDPNQDAGTFYGCESMLVLREVHNFRKRSIIMATGELTVRNAGMHVRWWKAGGSEYHRFEIDTVLGRLDCAPEPWLLHSKAQAHALTSFLLPDPLTGRTGAEESIAILLSSQSQPWTALPTLLSLKGISDLSPSRKWYPEDKRCLQTVEWDPNLTSTIQNDCYESVVASILEQSHNLKSFSLELSTETNTTTLSPSDLRTRGQTQQLKYERENASVKICCIGQDKKYNARDRQAGSSRGLRVFQTTKLLLTDDLRFSMDHNVTTIIERWNTVGGFTSSNPKVACPLSEMVEKHVGENWGNLVRYCHMIDPETEMYDLMFKLCLLSFGKRGDDEMDMVKVLAGFGFLHEFKALQLPTGAVFTDFRAKELPDLQKFQQLLTVGYSEYEEVKGIPKGQQAARRRAHLEALDSEAHHVAKSLINQWPAEKVILDNFITDLIDLDEATEGVAAEWARLCRNQELCQFLEEIQSTLSNFTTDAEILRQKPHWGKSKAYFWQRNMEVRPRLGKLLEQKCEMEIPRMSDINEVVEHEQQVVPWQSSTHNGRKCATLGSSRKEILELGGILEDFSLNSAGNMLRQQYTDDLKKSLEALKSFSNAAVSDSGLTIPELLIGQYINGTKASLDTTLDAIRMALAKSDESLRWLQGSRLWPCVTFVTLLEQLQSIKRRSLDPGWVECIIKFGVGITALQRGLRLKDAKLQNNPTRLADELENVGHRNWKPTDTPEWLLLEIDNNIRIRDEQVEVAKAIISPPSSNNTVLQLNMGRGKTSCILPMAAAVLADGVQLSRLIVPKALLMQTAQILQTKLGRLLDRRILHIPFSRKTPTSLQMTAAYQALHKQVLQSHGVILTMPETILSFKLSGLQRLKDLRIGEAREMINFQDWLTEKCRDIIDESDFSLAVKTQLIYPSGFQEALDGHALRWQVCQELLALVESHLTNLHKDFPDGIIIVRRQHGFPTIYFLKDHVEDALTEKLIRDVAAGRLAQLRLISTAKEEKVTVEIQRVLSGEDLIRKHFRRAARHFADRETAYKCLLLVRGLLRHKVLLSCLKKRWNVQFGLHPKRDPIAVPYEAKGVPHEQSEFGHPDASVAFTCLSFYYGGVTFPQFREALQRLLGSDDPATEYDRWTAGCQTLSSSLRQWNALNLEDEPQILHLWRTMRFRRSMVNNYLNNFVFPIHAKQFTVKLQASGWDLPQFSPGGSKLANITAGFSGTNDNKSLLPQTIQQHDLPSLLHTNALVLTYLLQERSREYFKAAEPDGRSLSEAGLLQRLHSKRIRLLIDAGAYILDMDNKALVERWLEIDTEAKAAVFFRPDNRAWVTYRGGRKPETPLLATPFVDRLEDCVVLLDQSHTRGTDFKFPPRTRGALTLALNQTKDHTVQAAMRLRQLESTQAVTFVAPPEVHQNILDVCGKKPTENIDSSDVVCWLLEQTCRANDALRNLYIAQGQDFCQRLDAAFVNGHMLSDKRQREALIKVIEQPEKQTLEESYGEMAARSKSSNGVRSKTNLTSRRLGKMWKELSLLAASTASTPDSRFDVLGEVEQEREVEYQVEEVRQVKKLPKRSALVFPKLHKYLEQFLEHGALPNNHKFKHAIAVIARTAVGKKYELAQRSSKLYVSEEFLRTVYLKTHELQLNEGDEYLRPIEWILWSPSSETAVVIIPEEAEAMIHRLKSQRSPKVYLLAYLAPVTKEMIKLGQLDYYTLPILPSNHKFPTWLRIELGILAGSLYFSYDDYIISKQLVGDNRDDASTLSLLSTLATDSRGFLLEWLTFRRKGQDIQHTPMGFLCLGRHISRSHPLFGARALEQFPAAQSTADISAHDNSSSDEGEEDIEDDDDSGSDWEMMDVNNDVDEFGGSDGVDAAKSE